MKSSKVLCRGLAKLFGLMKRERKRRRKTNENIHLAVQFFTGGGDNDDETLSSSTISPANATQLHQIGVDDFMDCFPSLHGKDEVSIAAFHSDDDEAQLNEQSQRSRERGWTESTLRSRESVSHSMICAVVA